jgi:hypothetical protein
MSLDVDLYNPDGECVYTANITHNLNKMADAAGIYKHLWRPEEIGVTTAAQLIEPLRAGLAQMVERPTHFEQFNASNGWGLYENFVPWIAKYLEACIANPDATIRVSR